MNKIPIVSVDNKDYGEEKIISTFCPINKIIDHLFLGNVIAFNTPDLFYFLKIKHVISLRAVDDHLLKLVLEENPNISHHKFYFSHQEFVNNEEKFCQIFEKIWTIINNALLRKENVFIHCRSGQHRSVTMLAGVLMKMFNYDWKTAFEIIKNKRMCVEEKFILTNDFKVIEME